MKAKILYMIESSRYKKKALEAFDWPRNLSLNLGNNLLLYNIHKFYKTKKEKQE